MENRLARLGALLAAALGLMLVPVPSFAQEDEEIFFPFVSHMQTEASGDQVKITWKDPPGIPGQFTIYRSTQELTAETLQSAQVAGRVASGVQYFIDTPPDPGTYFYAVLEQTADGVLHAVLIPFRNKSLVAASVRREPTEEEAAARITAIHAAAAPDAGGVEVTFQASNPARDLLLFRSTSPLAVPEDLLGATSATQIDPGTTRFVVPALPGVQYWFAVLDAGLFKIGRIPIAQGQNATIDPVEVPASAGGISLAPARASIRPMPLPSLELSYGIQTGRPFANPDVPDLPRQQKVSAQTEKAIAALLASTPEVKQPALEPTVLSADATPALDADTGALQQIINGPFLGGDLEKAAQGLNGYLTFHRAPQLEARARFYLGQVRYFQGRPQDALLLFLQAQDFYFHDAQRWEDGCYLLLEKSGRQRFDPGAQS